MNTSSGEYIISASNVTKSFKEVHALREVNLHVPKGSVQALLGPNGAGKTTLVRIMTTLLKADSGTVTIAGLDTEKDVDQLRTQIGLAGQYAAVDEELTGYENLRLFGRLYHLPTQQAEARARELLTQFGLNDAADRPTKTYSGGMRRRLDLAASLIVNPPVLFLDEPTTGLDPASRQDLWNIIRDLVRQGTTVLLTTQYLEEADQLADNIAVIDHGAIIAQGTSDELKAKSGGNVLEVTIQSADHLEDAVEVLRAVGNQEPDVNKEKLHLSMPIEGGTDVVMDVMRALDAKNVTLVDIQLRRPTLDDVFIALTGARTESETTQQPT